VVNAAVEFDDVNLWPTYRLMVGVPGGSSGIAIAQRLGVATSIIERARSLLTPESREAADLIAYLHRSRDELDRMQQQMAAERHALEEERKKLRTEWIERQQKRIKELESQFAEMQKRFDENVARVIEAVKERELRASLEKTAKRKGQDIRSPRRIECRRGADYFRVTVGSWRACRCNGIGKRRAAATWRTNSRAGLQQAGHLSSLGWFVGRNRSWSAAHESRRR
jgi:dsDNA-specific endonuclease/ATPase MutS2